MAVQENLVIPQGVYQGVTLRLKGKGHNSTLSKKCGDLLIRISIRPHNYFKRDLYNIKTDRYISVTQAILGGRVKVQTLYGIQEIEVKNATHDGH